MPENFHQTIPVLVWADIDVGIADMVRYLNTIPGVRTLASCQGTIGEGGPKPYRAQVLVTWEDDATFERLKSEFDVSEIEPGENIPNHWCYLHPRVAPPVDGIKLTETERLKTIEAAARSFIDEHDRNGYDAKAHLEAHEALRAALGLDCARANDDHS